MRLAKDWVKGSYSDRKESEHPVLCRFHFLP
jgi:hypothetical protein